MTLYRVLKWTALLLIAMAAVCVAIAAVIVAAHVIGPSVTSLPESYSRGEFVTIVLAAVTAVVAVLTLVLTVAAVVGYVTIRDGAQMHARTVAQDVAERIAKATAAEVAAPIATRTAVDVVTELLGRGGMSADDIARSAGTGEGDLTSGTSN